MTDANEQSIPSRGSHGSPFAWAITANGRFVEAHGTKDMAWVCVRVRESEMALIEGVPCDAGGTPVEHDVVPLYAHPVFTDEEREAIACAAESYADNDDDEDCARVAATLRGLLKRTDVK